MGCVEAVSDQPSAVRKSVRCRVVIAACSKPQSSGFCLWVVGRGLKAEN